MTEVLLEKLISKIFSFSGIVLMPTQRLTLENYIETKAASKNLSVENYCELLKEGSEDFNALINSVTVNETYFFREQKQFEFLEKEIFPKFKGKKMNIWSAASSTGEEAISLLALALHCGVEATVFATDIDENALATFKKGVYSRNSFRPDGMSYHSLLDKYSRKTDKEVIINQDFIEKIKKYRFNLLTDSPKLFANSVDLIFIRNVFIYFDKPTRKTIIEKITSILADSGNLFFSMNEIGCINQSLVPSYLHKRNYGMVYYFIRDNELKNEILSSSSEKLPKIEKKVEKPEAITKSVVKSPSVAAEKKVSPNVLSVAKTETSVATQSIGSTVSDSGDDIKKIFSEVCKAINQSLYDKARNLAGEIKGTFKTKFYTSFLQGYTEYYAGDKKKAEVLFSSAELMKDDFWPSLFYHGLTLKDLGRKSEANKYFIKCQLVLDTYKDGRNNPYDFIVDYFNPAYIYSLCQTLQRDQANA